MKVHLLRHTKPDIPEGICYGQTDIELFSSFDTEKEDVRSLLGSTKHGTIYSSPLKRCVSLARYLIPDNDKLIIDDRLKELNFGTWEMKSWKDIEQTPDAVEWFDDYINVPAPGGESFTHLLERVRHFIDDLKKNQSEDPVLIVTHLGVIRAFSAIVTNTEPMMAFDLNVGYGEIYEIEVSSDSTTTTREHFAPSCSLELR
ncbi:MAG: alpha-ribazole phosphatase [Bacteroidota bacterium]|nr:alpha-ribazole phosphatase [Bacteroidota bacterium]